MQKNRIECEVVEISDRAIVVKIVNKWLAQPQRSLLGRPAWDRPSKFGIYCGHMFLLLPLLPRWPSGTLTPGTAAALPAMTEPLVVLIDTGIAAALLVHAKIPPSTARRQDRHIVTDVKADSFSSGMASGFQDTCMCARHKNSGIRILSTVLKSVYNSMDQQHVVKTSSY